jgi:hypothetical protein
VFRPTHRYPMPKNNGHGNLSLRRTVDEPQNRHCVIRGFETCKALLAAAEALLKADSRILADLNGLIILDECHGDLARSQDLPGDIGVRRINPRSAPYSGSMSEIACYRQRRFSCGHLDEHWVTSKGQFLSLFILSGPGRFRALRVSIRRWRIEMDDFQLGKH